MGLDFGVHASHAKDVTNSELGLEQGMLLRSTSFSETCDGTHKLAALLKDGVPSPRQRVWCRQSSQDGRGTIEKPVASFLNALNTRTLGPEPLNPKPSLSGLANQFSTLNPKP